jgi:hypothetical protein
VLVQIVSPGGKTESVRLSPHDEWGLFTAPFTPRESGTYQFTLSCKENNSSLETGLSVQHVRKERIGQPARIDVLTEIAAITGGKLAKTDDLQPLLEGIAALPEQIPSVKRLRIWCHPAWAGMIVLLLGLFWTARKITGVI